MTELGLESISHSHRPMFETKQYRPVTDPRSRAFDCDDAHICNEKLESWCYLALDSSTVVDLFEVELDMAEDLLEVSVCPGDAEPRITDDMEEASGSIMLAFRNGGCKGKGIG